MLHKHLLEKGREDSGHFWEVTHEYFCVGVMHAPFSMCPKAKLRFYPKPTLLFLQQMPHQPAVAQASTLTIVTSDQVPRSDKYQVSFPLTAASFIQPIIISSSLWGAPLRSTWDAAA